MRILRRRACRAANLARARGVAQKPRFIARIKRRYDATLAEGFAFHEAQTPLGEARGKANSRGRPPRGTGRNLLARLAHLPNSFLRFARNLVEQGARLDHRKEDVLRFLDDPSVPFTNNQAEGDVRTMNVKRKISGGFRSAAGAEDFAIPRSIFSTARKQGWNILHTLVQNPAKPIDAVRAS